MRDGKTRQRKKPASAGQGMAGFLDRHVVKIVVVAGDEAGREFPLERQRTTLGRGPGVDVAIPDACMSRQHAAIDCTRDGFRIQDLGSTNGIVLDGKPVQAGTLSHGSLFELGGRAFQFVVEERAEMVPVYELPSEG